MSIKMTQIQAEIKAPKNNYNSFGKYKYRSAEDILEAAKPVLAKYGCYLTLRDEILMLGERYYVKATATICGDDEQIETCAYAREEDSKKGMDGSQITGTASSYARKYALNGLFCLDDTKDADTDEYQMSRRAPGPAKKNDDIRTKARKRVMEQAEKMGISMRDLAKEYKLNNGTTAERFEEVLLDLKGNEYNSQEAR